jgi:hypothetical protein
VGLRLLKLLKLDIDEFPRLKQYEKNQETVKLISMLWKTHPSKKTTVLIVEERFRGNTYALVELLRVLQRKKMHHQAVGLWKRNNLENCKAAKHFTQYIDCLKYDFE